MFQGKENLFKQLARLCPLGKPALISLRSTLPSCHKPIEQFLLGVKDKKYVQDTLSQEKVHISPSHSTEMVPVSGYPFPAFYLHLQDQLETVHVEVLVSTDFI